MYVNFGEIGTTIQNLVKSFQEKVKIQKKLDSINDIKVELVSKELNHLAAILHVYAGGLNFMK